MCDDTRTLDGSLVRGHALVAVTRKSSRDPVCRAGFLDFPHRDSRVTSSAWRLGELG